MGLSSNEHRMIVVIPVRYGQGPL